MKPLLLALILVILQLASEANGLVASTGRIKSNLVITASFFILTLCNTSLSILFVHRPVTRIFQKEEKGPKKNQGNCFIIREEIHSLYRRKCHFERRWFHTWTRMKVTIHSTVIWKTVISIMAESTNSRTVYKLQKKENAFFAQFQRARFLVSTKATRCIAFDPNNLIILMTSTGKLLVLLRPGKIIVISLNVNSFQKKYLGILRDVNPASVSR